MKSKGEILISWIGKSDTDKVSANNFEKGDGGPLHTILEFKNFSKLYLMHTDDKAMSDNVKSISHKIKSKCSECHFIPVNLKNPSDPSEVYKETCKTLKTIEKYNSLLYYNVTSGTPAMYAALLLVASCTYPGKVLRTIEKKFANGGTQVHEVTLPFSLSLLQKNAPSRDELFIADVNKYIFEQAQMKVAPTNASVLILGKTGVGKSALARFIHEHSPRNDKDIVEINCAEISGGHENMRSELFGHEKGAFTGADSQHLGVFERANGSTLFLDEIGEIPLHLQSMLLRVLDSGKVTRMKGTKEIPVDVRIVAATNKNLLKEVNQGRFREDLYYRLAHYSPTLKSIEEYSTKDRKKLIYTLLNKINKDYHTAQPRTINKEALELLCKYKWPGNIREAIYRLRSICLLSDEEIREDDVDSQIHNTEFKNEADITEMMPPNIPHGFNLDKHLEKIEKHFIKVARQHIKTTRGIADALGIKNESTLRSRIKKLESQADE